MFITYGLFYNVECCRFLWLKSYLKSSLKSNAAISMEVVASVENRLVIDMCQYAIITGADTQWIIEIDIVVPPLYHLYANIHYTVTHSGIDICSAVCRSSSLRTKMLNCCLHQQLHTICCLRDRSSMTIQELNKFIQVAQLWQRDRANLYTFSINVQLYSQNHAQNSIFLRHSMGHYGQRMRIIWKF